MSSSRSSALLKIMRIEDQVKRLHKDKRYRTIQESVRTRRDSYGKSIIEVANPQDFEKRVTLRKNSDAAKEYLEIYELMLYEYEVLMHELDKQKKMLRNQLFA